MTFTTLTSQELMFNVNLQELMFLNLLKGILEKYEGLMFIISKKVGLY